MTTLSITVSLGYGVPDRPQVGKKKPPPPPATVDGNGDAGGGTVAPGTTASLIVPVGPVSTITFSTSDSISSSVGDSHDDSDAATGKVDTGSFAGSSNASASKILALTEFDALRPDGSLGHTIQLTAADDRTAGMSFKGGNTLFEAEGNVLDGDGNTTNNGTNPFGTPFSSPGSKPPTNGDNFFDGTDMPPPMGGDGSRVDASAGLGVSSSFSTGSYFLAEATTAVGTEFAESDITGTAGMHTDYAGSIAVNDALSLDVQSSDATTGEYDYLSFGWAEAANASRGLHFAYDMDLGDADLPDDPNPDNTNGAPPTNPLGGSLPTSPASGTGDPGTTGSGTPASTAPSSTGSDGSGSTGSGGELSAPSSGGTSGSAGSGSGASSTPAVGQPVIELDSLSAEGGSSKAWVQRSADKSWEVPSTFPGAPSNRHTEKALTSVRIGGSAEISAKITLVNWAPSVVATAKGNFNVSFLNSSIHEVNRDFDFAPVPNFTRVISEKRDTHKVSDFATATIDFDIQATLSLNAAPTITGTVKIDVTLDEKLRVTNDAHELIVNLSNRR